MVEERARGAMYCVNCGTVNRDGAVTCEKCGQDLEKQRQPQAQTAVDVTLAARTETMPYNRDTDWLTSRLVMVALVAVLLVLVPMIIAIRNAVNPGRTPTATETTATGNLTLPRLNDAVRKQNGKRLQMAVDDFFVRHGRYPQSLSEVPPEELRFTPDPHVYSYAPTQNPPGYRIEVILLDDSAGDHVVNEDGITKMILRPFVPARRSR